MDSRLTQTPKISPDVLAAILKALAQNPPNTTVPVAQAPTPVLPTKLNFDTGVITFPNGVPVNGRSTIELHQDGTYIFYSSFYDSGAPSYSDTIVHVVKAGAAAAFTFTHAGTMYGTFDSGSRTDGATVTGTNPMIASLWPTLCASYSWTCHSHVDVDWGVIINDVKALVTTVEQVIAVVGPLLA